MGDSAPSAATGTAGAQRLIQKGAEIAGVVDISRQRVGQILQALARNGEFLDKCFNS